MQARSIVSKPINSLSSSQRESENFYGLDLALGLFISIALLFAIVIPISAYIFKGRQYSLNIKPRTKFSCHQCQYVGNNNYLKCALHPSTVFTEQAVDCKDYQPNIRTQRVGKLRKMWQKIRNIFSA
jgi:hypothetical protein